VRRTAGSTPSTPATSGSPTGRELLARWRAGQIDAEAEPRTWQHGELLDYVDRHGDVPRRDTRWGRQPDHRVRPFGAGRLMADLHLTFSDTGAAGVLLLCLTGQNYSTISTATATHHRADGHTGSTATAVVDLVKPRRGRDRAHMPTALSSSAPGEPGGSPHRQFDLHTPFGVYTLLVDLAGPARARVGTDLLLFCSKGVENARGFRTGLPNSILTSWSRGANLRADALGEDGLAIPLVVYASPPPTTRPENLTMATDHDDERDAITAAIQRLLDGRPTRSTGALTTLQLAAEAGVKRWVLTHKHVNLKEEFVR
jgi:hypothetical protein